MPDHPFSRRAPFVGRARELSLLQRLWSSPKAEMLILYGRRRVGKTRLLMHWLEIDKPRALYWVAEPTSPYDQLRSFSQALYNFMNPGLAAPEGFAYASWRQAFQQLAPAARGERIAVLLDEFTYLLATEAGIAGILQNTWDRLLQETNIFLAISGSHIGMMERELLSYQAPLYGRATALLKLHPLPFSETRHFFPRYHPDERVAVYAMLGGIPAYWERFDPQASIDANIRQRFLEPNNLILEEPRLLLQDFISEAHNYVAVLRAIAHNHRTPKEIAGYTGILDKHVSAYLARLVETGFVERRIPLIDRENSRQGRHHITDPFLRFYFRFLSRRQAQLAQGLQDQALAEIKQHLVDFIGTHTWEELCQDWLLRAGGRGLLPFLPDQVGGIWNRRAGALAAQVDVAGINFMDKTLILGECKWDRHAQGREVLAGLVEKTALILPREGDWQVYYIGFSRRGWTDAAQRYASEIDPQQVRGERWRAVGMGLLDLDQVDGDLAAWE